ncbi:MAG TPA: radical SAM family heme chaperone HemW [Thermodesulfobacteriota bacterium]|nr:radical SAM family heme chaperone HemW [Thermodesulfobacteriota bacterium]
MMKTPGLYIHIPFCRTKCPYCNFYSTTGAGKIPDFLSAVTAEMELVKKQWSAFDTVYVGGGTPSLLAPSQVEELLSAVRTSFSILPGAEITFEANPGDIDARYLGALREIGINRLNIGVQSFDDGVLKFLGRRHSAAQALSSIESARAAGFENLGLDLIFGVPGQSLRGWMDDLARAAAFAPEHLSCYQLTFEQGTPLDAARLRGEFPVHPDDELLPFFMATSEKLERSGYSHYEISNFAREGRASMHNRKYWDHTPYLGLGPSAHSFSGNRRSWNVLRVDAYISALGRGSLPVEDGETLSPEQLRFEALFLGLRTKRGIDLEDFRLRHGCDLLNSNGERISFLSSRGFLNIENGRLYPTRAGMSVADTLALL